MAAVPRQHRDRRHAGGPARLLPRAGRRHHEPVLGGRGRRAGHRPAHRRARLPAPDGQRPPCAVGPHRPVAHHTVEHGHPLEPPQHAESPDHRARPRSDRAPPPPHDHHHLVPPPHPPQRRAAAAAAGRRHRARRLRSTSVSATNGALPAGHAQLRRRPARHRRRVPPGPALARVVRRPGAAADRDPAQRPRPGDDPPPRPAPTQPRPATDALALKQLVWSALGVVIAAACSSRCATTGGCGATPTPPWWSASRCCCCRCVPGLGRSDHGARIWIGLGPSPSSPARSPRSCWPSSSPATWCRPATCSPSSARRFAGHRPAPGPRPRPDPRRLAGQPGCPRLREATSAPRCCSSACSSHALRRHRAALVDRHRHGAVLRRRLPGLPALRPRPAARRLLWLHPFSERALETSDQLRPGPDGHGLGRAVRHRPRPRAPRADLLRRERLHHPQPRARSSAWSASSPCSCSTR